MRATVAVGAVLLVGATLAHGAVDCEATRCAVQAAIDAECDCAGAATHGGHVRCVGNAARTLVQAGDLPVKCKGAVRRCAARSVCGKPAGSVVCDLPARCAAGACSRCRIVRSAERCLARGGTVSSRPSCCPSCEPPARTPCGPTLTCDAATEVCVAREPVGPAIVYECRPVPAGCEADRSCACAGASLCLPPFDVCGDVGPNAIDCVCPLCQ